MTTNQTNTSEWYERIPLDRIDFDPDNRHAVPDPAFDASIARHGVLQPVIVTQTGDEPGRYRLIAGERRCRAAIAAGHVDVPPVVDRDADDTTAIVIQAVENLQRQDLSVTDEARQVARIMAAGMKQKALAATLKRPLSWVRARLAIVALGADVQVAIDAGDLEPSDALILGRYAECRDVIAAALDRPGGDLAWKLERAAEQIDRRRQDDELVAERQAAGIAAYLDELPADLDGARRLDDVHLDADSHRGEPCHAEVIDVAWSGVRVTGYCTESARHPHRGDSELKAIKPTPSDADRERSERERATRAANSHRAEFARTAIAAKLRSRDLLDFVLPVLFDTAGQTELTDAAKFLHVIDPATSEQSNHKDWAGPFRQWASASTANLTRAMLAVAYV
ncbi:MAG: ParB/RepB/Spo0J family partition protein [Acidimicrobiales bacterium]